MQSLSPPGTGPATLKSAQLAAVDSMLSLPSSSDRNGDASSPWKILVYDRHTRGIISPLLSVSALRERGVTLHLLLGSEREPIPDVPAVYFVQPTQENLALIARDCSRSLYRCAHLHFSTRIDRPVMEEFARLVVNTGGLDAVASVHDQHVEFACLERRLFSLNVPRSYVLYNSPDATGEDMERAMDAVAAGLFSVVATLGAVPVIRCPRGGAPEMVSRKLCGMIAEHPGLVRGRDGGGPRAAGLPGGHHRPVLVVMDRNMDLITPIQHASTYQALVDDVLDHSANRVEFDVAPEGDAAGRRGRAPPPVRKRYDVDPDSDPFLGRHRFSPFPEAIESNGAELQDITAREQAIRSKTSGGGGGSDAAGGGNSSDLSAAVESLPALLDRKKKLEVHTSILQAAMNEVASRDVPAFFELETGLASGSYRNDTAKAKADVTGLVTDPAKGNVCDKVRLVLVYALSNGVGSTPDIDDVASAMRESLETRGSVVGTAAGGDGGAPPAAASHGTLTPDDRSRLDAGLRAVEYLKRLRSMHMIPVSDAPSAESASSSAPPSSSVGSDMLSSLVARATNQATGLLAKATDRLGTMLGRAHKARATSVVENICEMRPGTEDDEYLYLDPRVKGDVDVSALRNAARAPAREAIAFVIGGGCYAEYQNIQSVADGGGRTVTYGSTEIVDPCTFLGHLGGL